ncbi:MAG: protein O-mannosyl-transferase [Acidobacteriota bacterium]|nr:protein O-mannosyl-transferase [Acidobacteriota bacterium]
MRRLLTRLFLALIICASCAVALARAQRPDAPNVIQIYMPDGSQPSSVMRFTLTRDDGRIETLFTDSKGKYSMTNDLVSASGYTITVETDRQTYDTTTTVFHILRVAESVYVSVYLRPLKRPALPRAQVIDAAELDAGVPAEAQAAYKEGMELIAKGQADAGVESLKRALGLYPNYVRALNDLGVVYLEQNRLDDAADAFIRALKLNSRFPYARLNLGITLDRQGKHAEAAALLETLFKENPTLAGVRATYADALYNAGRLADARKMLRAGLEDATLKREEKAELHYKLGRVLSREEKTAEAVKELQAATELEPTAFNAHLLLGGSLIALKRPAEAERSLLRAYELGGTRAGHAQLMLGQLYFEQKKFDLSLRAFEQYLRDVPDARNAAQIRDVVARLQGTPK